MARYTMDMVLEYASIFPENADMGDMDGANWQQNIAKKGGQFVVNAYFTSEEQIAQLQNDGMQMQIMGNDRVREGNEEYGIGKYIKLKRAVPDDIRDWKDPLTGENVNLGGPVKVVDFTQGKEGLRNWSYEEDGELGNGTKAKVQFETYSKGLGVRLNGVAVTEHVVRTMSENEDDAIFRVA